MLQSSSGLSNPENPSWVSLQIKATGDLCNLACRYCLYRRVTEKTFMPDEVLRETVRKALRHNRDTAVFCWFGGEPVLAGIQFYERAIAYQREFAGETTSVVNQIQTNGTLITREIANFLQEHQFGVGVSIDGLSEVHNRMRVDKGGVGSYDRAVRGLKTLQDSGVRPSVIATVSKDTLPFARQTFRHLVGLGVLCISYSPVFDSPVGEYPSITNDEWYGYLRQVFDEWCRFGNPEVSVRELNEVIAWISGVSDPCCSSLGTCSRWFLIDYDGNIYPCEKWNRSMCYGNILTHGFYDVTHSLQHRRFVQIASYRPEKCRECKFLMVCNNGCTRMRVLDGRFNPLGLYAFCEQRMALFREVEGTFASAISDRRR